MIEGLPVETQFTTPFRSGRRRARPLARGPGCGARDDRAGASRESSDRGVAARSTCGCIRVGMRAAADRAEVARARRDARPSVRRSRPADAPGRARARSSSRPTGIGAELAADRDWTPRSRSIDAERTRLARSRRPPRGRTPPSAGQARGNPYLVAYCRWREAEARLERRRSRRRRDRPLARRIAIAHGSGAAPLAGRVEGLAARSRLDLAGEGPTTAPDPGRRSRDDPFGLTRRERDVLPLLVKGRTNRQIAEELFISENTAGVHVSNILGKLGASTKPPDRSGWVSASTS